MTEGAHSRKRVRKRSIAGIVIKVILIALLIINIAVICMGNAKGSEIISNIPYSLIPILSDSMSPLIKSGDAVLVKQESYEAIEPGDVVIYERDGELIVHEVITKSDDSFVTKGIQNTKEDDPVSSGQYRAKYVMTVPLLGGIWRISGNGFKFALLAVLLGLIIFGDQIFSVFYARYFDKTDDQESDKVQDGH